MLPVPLELKALVVHELAHDQKDLSTVSLVWPETISYIREHRFKNLYIHGPDELSRFLRLMGGAPAISSAIRYISIITPRTQADSPLRVREQYRNMMTLIMAVPNLEELSLDGNNLSKFDLVLSSSPSSSIKLKKLTLRQSHTSLKSFLDILRSFPHLTNLSLLCVDIMDLSQIAKDVWNLSERTSALPQPEHCVMWDTQGIEAPEEVAQVTSLTIHPFSASDLIFLDLLASSKTPFPNLEEIIFFDDDLQMCRPRRLPALLDRYKDTLHTLDLLGDAFYNRSEC